MSIGRGLLTVRSDAAVCETVQVTRWVIRVVYHDAIGHWAVEKVGLAPITHFPSHDGWNGREVCRCKQSVRHHKRITSERRLNVLHTYSW